MGEREKPLPGQWVVYRDGSWWACAEVVKATWARVWLEKGWLSSFYKMPVTSVLAVRNTEAEANQVASVGMNIEQKFRQQRTALNHEETAEIHAACRPTKD